MQKSFLLSVVLGVGFIPMFADNIRPQDAIDLAERFFISRSTSTRSSVESAALTVSKFQDLVYIVNNPAGGWVILSSDDRVPEIILGYSLQGSLYPEALPIGIEDLLHNFVCGIADIESGIYSSVIPLTRSETEVSPLLGEIAWDQGYPYNSMCPYIEEAGEKALVGCVTNAEAQIMYYHRYPSSGTGEYLYEWKGTEYSMDFNKSVYRWDLMKPTYDGTESQASVEAVAKLNYDVAISNASMFGISGTLTGALLWGYPMVEFFGYDPSILMIDRTRCTRQYWEEILRSEISAGRPVYVQASNDFGGGHAFVCDGFDTAGYFHYNMGGGSGGYFLSSATGWDVTPSMICSIKPKENGAHAGLWAGSSESFLWKEGDRISCLMRGDITSQVVSKIDVALALENKFSSEVQYFVKFTDTSVFFELTDLTFGNKVDDGEYILYPVYRVDDTEWKKVNFVDNAADHVDLSVKDGVKTYINDTSGGDQDEDVILINGVYYRFKDDEAMVTARNNMGNCYTGDVFIPSYVEFQGEYYPVTSIDKSAFKASIINSLIIGDNISSIGFAAFKESIVGKLTFAEGSKLSFLGDQVFYGCRVDELAFPEGLESTSYLMCGCCYIKKIDIPSSVKYMSSWSILNETDDGLEDLTVHWNSVDQLPEYGDRAIDGNVSNTVLHVPSGCADVYRNHELWGIFKTIKEDAEAGVNDIFSDSECYDVYSLGGLRIKQGADCDEFKSLKPGIYIIRNGADMKKLVIR